MFMTYRCSQLTILNAAIVTECGTYRYEALTLAQAREAVRECLASGVPVVSAVGHAATAAWLSELLGIPVSGATARVSPKPQRSGVGVQTTGPFARGLCADAR